MDPRPDEKNQVNTGEHTVTGEIDAAYARNNIGERFDGLTHPENHDGVPTVIDAWADPAMGYVDVTVAETNIRLNLPPRAAADLGRILLREAAIASHGAIPIPDADEEEWQHLKPAAWAPDRFPEHNPVGTVYPPEDSYSADEHDQIVVKTWDGTRIGVDVRMAPVLTGLWRLGYRTYASCQGDHGEWLERGWAWIDFESPDMAQKFTSDFTLTGSRVTTSTVWFPAADVTELHRELRRRSGLAAWEEIRDVALRQVSDLESMFATGIQSVTEAELAAQGIYPVTIAHGHPETEDEYRLVGELPELAAECGQLAGIRGGSEHTTYLFTGPAAADTAAAFTAQVTSRTTPRWWRITPTAYPPWHSAT